MKNSSRVALLLLFFAAIALVSGLARAGGTGNASATTETTAQSGAVSKSGSMVSVGNNRSSYNYSPATDLSRAVPGVIAPNPSVGFNVCDSAFTVGFGFSGLGVGFGVPVSDTQCNRRADAIAMKNLGDSATGKEIMCETVRAFRASYRANRPCFPNPDLLDELNEEELKVLEYWREQERAKQDVQNAMAKRNVYKELNLLEERVDKKLDNFHRINQMK